MNTHVEKSFQKELEKGQGLVEYALILALVAIVAVVALSIFGQGVQRVFAITTAALDGRHDTTGAQIVQITTAQCIAVQSSNVTGLWVVGVTNLDVTTLTGSTEQSVGQGLGGAASPVTTNGPGGFKFNPLLAYEANTSVCPQAVVIQSSDGSIALAPVEAVLVP
jgi:Flp pilus assembly pilin Flp